ncbi:hypothetical protein JW766_03125 [Candidatus Dojkabacteria bacterium]|nr:hypothetical protein [Candidatus Dojkabacteria bacterium]
MGEDRSVAIVEGQNEAYGAVHQASPDVRVRASRVAALTTTLLLLASLACTLSTSPIESTSSSQATIPPAAASTPTVPSFPTNDFALLPNPFVPGEERQCDLGVMETVSSVRFRSGDTIAFQAPDDWTLGGTSLILVTIVSSGGVVEVTARWEIDTYTQDLEVDGTRPLDHAGCPLAFNLNLPGAMGTDFALLVWEPGSGDGDLAAALFDVP